NRHRELAAPLQHDQAARLTWIQATGTGGIRARLRRVAGCAIPSGSAGHAGETANLKLTFHLDHSEGADHSLRRRFRALYRTTPIPTDAGVISPPHFMKSRLTLYLTRRSGTMCQSTELSRTRRVSICFGTS